MAVHFLDVKIHYQFQVIKVTYTFQAIKEFNCMLTNDPGYQQKLLLMIKINFRYLLLEAEKRDRVIDQNVRLSLFILIKL